MSALRIRLPGGIVRDVDLGPSQPVLLRGYSLRGAAVTGTSEYANARQSMRKYVEANREAVNARQRKP